MLFAIRPRSLIPWDEPIRKRLSLDGSAESYSAYLKRAKRALQELGEECATMDLALSDVPRLVGRPQSSVAKLVDEYLWVVATKGCPAPADTVLGQWADWAAER